MYCPNCGLEHLEQRRFCNRCGTNLEAVTRTLAGDFLDPPAAEKLENRQKAISRGFLVFCSGPVFGFSMVILAEVLKDLLGPQPSPPWGFRYPPIAYAIENLGFFGFLLSFIGLVMMINAFIVYGRKKHLLQQVAQQPQPLPESPARPVTQQSPPTSVTPSLTPPSVTENTTFELDPRERSLLRADTSPTEADQPAHKPKRQIEGGR